MALYIACPTMWNSAAANAPTPSCMTMKPICPAVDQTRPPFTSVRTSITAVANSAVSMPIANARAIAVADEAKTGEKRMSSTPAPLITPAWSSADTGVGAASVEGSHRWIGTSADRAIPPSTSSVATTVSALTPAICSPSSAAALGTDRPQVDVTDQYEGDDHRHDEHAVADEEAPPGPALRSDCRRPRSPVTDECHEHDAGGDPADDEPGAGRGDRHHGGRRREHEREHVESPAPQITSQ